MCCKELVQDILRCGETHASAYLRYLLALSEFHLGSITTASGIFRELEREPDYTLGRRRIVKSYLASTPDGRPVVYSGTVAWIDESSNRGKLYVDRLRHSILFLPRTFTKQDIRRNDTIDRFHIAFNFIGPIADPIEFYEG